MDHYRNALNHLNIALDEMVEEMDSLVVANIAYPIQLIEIAILNLQTEMVRDRL